MWHLFLPACLALPLAAPLLPGDGGTAPMPPSEGFTLFQPMRSNDAVLIDLSGAVVHTWPGAHEPGLSVYLTEDWHLLRSMQISPGSGPAGAGGAIQEVDWDGTVRWEVQYFLEDEYMQHHDFHALPNGNLLLVAWDYYSDLEAIEQGRNPAYLSHDLFLPDSIIEIDPDASGGTIVWEWHVWDHLIQDHDPTKPNYGVVADHPERVDLNYPPKPTLNDWNHVNSVHYHPEFDQILLSVHHFHEIWVIDHSTTTEEAAGHTGGNSGKGGDLLYRWGNPEAYRAGGPTDRQLFGQHDATWIDPGYPGEGNILIFNNGKGRPGGDHSTVDEIEPPVDASGFYSLTPGSAYGPSAPSWTYAAPNPPDFYSQNISGCQRLPNGNTLVCSGAQAWFFEVEPDGTLVWEHYNMNPPPPNNRVFKVRRYDLCEPGESYCSTSPNSVGPGAVIGHAGTPSVTANDLVLTVDGCPPDQLGLFYYGPNQVSIGFGEGLRCVGGKVFRLGVLQMDGSGFGTHALDVTAPPEPVGQIHAGDLWNFQCWYRDPAGGPSGFNVSDGLAVRFCP